ncbi:MAG: hypothetical protein VW443_12350 [Pseudomonadales bacterium]|jgi:hypothetical protein
MERLHIEDWLSIDRNTATRSLKERRIARALTMHPSQEGEARETLLLTKGSSEAHVDGLMWEGRHPVQLKRDEGISALLSGCETQVASRAHSSSFVEAWGVSSTKLGKRKRQGNLHSTSGVSFSLEFYFCGLWGQLGSALSVGTAVSTD